MKNLKKEEEKLVGTMLHNRCSRKHTASDEDVDSISYQQVERKRGSVRYAAYRGSKEITVCEWAQAIAETGPNGEKNRREINDVIAVSKFFYGVLFLTMHVLHYPRKLISKPSFGKQEESRKLRAKPNPSSLSCLTVPHSPD